ncbi:hypothetical protein ApDm4_1981 [Acetobacter pomorum]|nr:hypothetical protein ApDm4_1981 [Acetobacter pomorum]
MALRFSITDSVQTKHYEQDNVLNTCIFFTPSLTKPRSSASAIKLFTIDYRYC